MENYELEKWIWTEKDFDPIGWQDATVYSVWGSFTPNLEIDLDYVFQWNQQEVRLSLHFLGGAMHVGI